MKANSSRTVHLRTRKAGVFHLLSYALGLGAAYGASSAIATLAEAKTPGETYCYYGTCHRVKSIAETEALVGSEETLATSFYDSCERDKLNPCGLTSSGEVFRPDVADNAASPIYPDGTTLLVWSPDTRAAVVLRVNNAGPYWGDRKLDVSRATAERLGFKDRGVADLEVRVIDAPGEEEATYQKHRTYDRVPGYIGQFESLDDAHAGMAAVMALEAMAPSVMAPLSGGAVAAARATQQPAPQEANKSEEPKSTAVVAAATPVPASEPKEPASKPAAASAKPAPSAPVVVAEAPKVGEAKSPPTLSSAPATPQATAKVAAVETRVAKQSRARQTRVARNARPVKAARYANVRKAAARAAARRTKQPVMVASARTERVAKTRTAHTAPNDISVFSRYANAQQGPASGSRKSAARPVRLAYRES